jgi:hypothetical protein
VVPPAFKGSVRRPADSHRNRNELGLPVRQADRDGAYWLIGGRRTRGWDCKDPFHLGVKPSLFSRDFRSGRWIRLVQRARKWSWTRQSIAGITSPARKQLHIEKTAPADTAENSADAGCKSLIHFWPLQTGRRDFSRSFLGRCLPTLFAPAHVVPREGRTVNGSVRSDPTRG